MALVSNRVTTAVRRRARSSLGKRFGRFAVSAAAALAANEITLAVCLQANLNAGTGAALGWLAGSIVSYVLSRWAFDSKGKPNLLKETLPFWIVSAMVFTVLFLATKLGSHAAGWLGLTGGAKSLFVVGVNFLANCVTFVARFIFFHYVLFAVRGSAAAAVPAASGTPEEPFVRAEAEFPSGFSIGLADDRDDRDDDPER
jgi:putative flippase GtrA